MNGHVQIDRRGGRGVQKSFTRTDSTFCVSELILNETITFAL